MSSREEALTAAPAEDTRADRRRRAFETNLGFRLAEELGDLDETTRRSLTGRLGAAFASTRHAIDARTVARLGGRGAYVVLQAGASRAGGESHPFAERLMRRAAVALDGDRRAALARAISRAEVSRRHRVDMRRVWRIGGVRAYVTLIAGPDLRHRRALVDKDRRAPERPTLGFLALLGVVGVLATLGAGLILATLWAFGELMAHEPTRAVLAQLFHSTLEAAGR